MSEVINIKELNERIERESVFVDTLRGEMSKVIVGQTHLIDTLLIGLLSNGHILLEGVPGLAKTLAITTLAKAVDADFARIPVDEFDVILADLDKVRLDGVTQIDARGRLNFNVFGAVCNKIHEKSLFRAVFESIKI